VSRFVEEDGHEFVRHSSEEGIENHDFGDGKDIMIKNFGFCLGEEVRGFFEDECQHDILNPVNLSINSSICLSKSK
jgi:hypothetical protein